MPPTAETDERLAALLDELTAAAREGRTEWLEEAVRSDPDLAAELRDLWDAVMVTSAVASWAATEAYDPADTASAAPAQELALPCRMGDYVLT